jgi:hypothetical protein
MVHLGAIQVKEGTLETKRKKKVQKFFIVLGESYFGKLLVLAFAWRERERESHEKAVFS